VINRYRLGFLLAPPKPVSASNLRVRRAMAQ